MSLDWGSVSTNPISSNHIYPFNIFIQIHLLTFINITYATARPPYAVPVINGCLNASWTFKRFSGFKVKALSNKSAKELTSLNSSSDI